MLSLIAAGLLALPGLLVLVVTIPLVALLSLPSLAFLLCRRSTTKMATPSNPANDAPATVIITGGSSGIGLQLACQAARTKGIECIVILARNAEKLKEAQKTIEEAAGAETKVTVTAISVDVTDAEALKQKADEWMNEIIKPKGKEIVPEMPPGGFTFGPSEGKAPPTAASPKPPPAAPQEEKPAGTASRAAAPAFVYLFCCAGEPHPAHHYDVTSADYARICQVNQLGAIYTVQAFLPHMKAGTIQFCSSICGQIGVFGYTAYSPTKFALRGYAEALHMELLNSERDIHVQLAYPPDTDTPGFAKENESKPEECRLISETAGLSDPADIARKMLLSATSKNPPFAVHCNFDGFLVSTLTAGFAPITTFLDGVAQISLNSLLRWVSLFYLNDWYRIIRNCQQQKKDEPSKNPSPSKSETEKEDE
jgi:3-dehydrosphinganine reductase